MKTSKLMTPNNFSENAFLTCISVFLPENANYKFEKMPFQKCYFQRHSLKVNPPRKTELNPEKNEHLAC